MKNILKFIYLNLNRISFQITFGLVSVWTLINFVLNVMRYKGVDERLDMMQMVRLLILSSDSVLGTIFIFLFPLIVALPAGISYLDDSISGMELYYNSRMGRYHYRTARVVSGFFSGFLAFFIPIVSELVLSIFSFPLNATGNFMGVSMMQPVFRAEVESYLWHDLYIDHPILYMFVFILILSLIAGLLNTFTIALSMIFSFKYRLLLLLPAYAVLFSTNILSEILHTDYKTGYSYYLRAFETYARSEGFFVAAIFVLAICTILLSIGGIRKSD